MTNTLSRLLDASWRPTILVVGDVMLDRYVWGSVDRISCESPIPVLRMDRREERLGGAGSVAAILAALNVHVRLVSFVGDDPEGCAVRRLLEELNLASDTTLVAADRSTTVKERLWGRIQNRHPQQMLRVDLDNTSAIPPQLADDLLDTVRRSLEGVDVVLVSDYDEGVCAGRLINEVGKEARRRGIPVIADPARGVDFARYAACTAIAPNRTEAGIATGRDIVSPQDGIDAAGQLLACGVEAVIVTLDRDGIAWANVQGRAGVFSVEPRQVYDVTGAGDAVLCALGYGLAVGGDWEEAIQLANLAGGLEVQRLGVVPFRRAELLAEWEHRRDLPNHRIVTVEELEARLAGHRQRGDRVAMTNGCFDLLHPGHIAGLQFARSQGDCLVVGLNSDQSTAALKGRGRPIIDEQGRAEMLAALACVDYVVIFDDLSVESLVERVKPDVLVKSDQYSVEQVVGHQIVDQHGGCITLAPMQGNYSTSWLIERIREIADESSRASDEAR